MQAPNNKQSVAESPGMRRVLVESPSGRFCFATALKAAELVMLAKTRSLTAKCALILPAHCKEDLDDSLSATHKWVQVVGRIKCTVVPLTSSGLPAWPSSPTQVKVDEKDPVSAPGQVTVRITIPKCFANANVLQDMLKKPNKVLAEFLLVGA